MIPMDEPEKFQSIIAFVTDLYFSSRIEQVIRNLGYDIFWIEKSSDISTPENHLSEHQYAEPLVGSGAVLMHRLTSLQPVLLIFDLGNPFIPWKRWIALIKSAPATRRIPVLCYGSHVESDIFKTAKEVGADAVVSRSRFVNDMSKLIEKYARKVDLETIQITCTAPLSELAINGLQEFNRREYFEAHETLEAAWNEESAPGRELFRAVLQIAVAYLQIERGNYRGAIKMFLRVRQWIDPLPDWCRGINIAKLRSDSSLVYQSLLELGPEGISGFDQDLMKPVEYKI